MEFDRSINDLEIISEVMIIQSGAPIGEILYCPVR